MTTAMQRTFTDKRDARPLCILFELDARVRPYRDHWLREWIEEESEWDEWTGNPDPDEYTEEWYEMEAGDDYFCEHREQYDAAIWRPQREAA